MCAKQQGNRKLVHVKDVSGRLEFRKRSQAMSSSQTRLPPFPALSPPVPAESMPVLVTKPTSEWAVPQHDTLQAAMSNAGDNASNMHGRMDAAVRHHIFDSRLCHAGDMLYSPNAAGPLQQDH